MENWTLPSWLSLSVVADWLSVIGFCITGWVAWQAGKLKKYFFNRARIGEILPELSADSQVLIKALREWKTSASGEQSSLMAISRIRGRLVNLKNKLTSEEKKSLALVLSKIQRKKFLVFSQDVSGIRYEEAWKIATDLDGMIVQIENAHRDSSWR